MAAINAAEDADGVEAALLEAKNAINAVTKLPQPLNITTWNPHGNTFIQFGWDNGFTNAQITSKTAYVRDLNTNQITNGIFNHEDGAKVMFFRFDGYTVDGSGTNAYEIVITLVVGSDAYEFRSECKAGVIINLETEKAKAIAELEAYQVIKVMLNLDTLLKTGHYFNPLLLMVLLQLMRLLTMLSYRKH